MKTASVWIFLGFAVLANCLGGEKSVFLTIENYVSSAGAETRANCIKESGVPEEYVTKSEEEGEITPDKRFNCYLRCTFQNSKLVDDKGVINMDVLKSLLKATGPVFLEKVEKRCKQPTKDDLCDSALETCVCILSTAHEEHIHGA